MTVICKHVEKLIEKLNCNTEPVYVDCDLEKGEEIANCFPIVEKRVQESGGSQVMGWHIRKGNLLVEAEFHAVWKTSEGNLKDISPKDVLFKQILFVPDPKAKYEGKQVDNIRINISGNMLMDDFIEICGAIFKLENKGDRAYQYELELIGEERSAWVMFQKARLVLEMMALNGLSQHDPCFCGSGNKYENCHQKQILETARSI